jgi:hypothetical protein
MLQCDITIVITIFNFFTVSPLTQFFQWRLPVNIQFPWRYWMTLAGIQSTVYTVRRFWWSWIHYHYTCLSRFSTISVLSTALFISVSNLPVINGQVSETYQLTHSVVQGSAVEEVLLLCGAWWFTTVLTNLPLYLSSSHLHHLLAGLSCVLINKKTHKKQNSVYKWLEVCKRKRIFM